MSHCLRCHGQLQGSACFTCSPVKSALISAALSRGVSPDLIPGLAVLGAFDVEAVDLVCSREGCGTVITAGCGFGENADLCRQCDWAADRAARREAVMSALAESTANRERVEAECEAMRKAMEGAAA